MADWLQPALTYARSWLQFQHRVHDLPGLQCAIRGDGKVLLDLAIGKASLASGAPLTSDTRLRVASHSKTFTAFGVMKLVDQGRLRLDDKAGQHVTGLHPDTADATIAQLLSHSAGIIRDGTDAGQWQGRRDFLNEAELRAALADAPLIPANTRFKYSNHGFGLLGLIIEAVTGEPYATWMAREVVSPAGLAATMPDAPVPEGTPLADGHGNKLLLGKRFVVPMAQGTGALAAATGFVSTAKDLTALIAQLDPAAPASILSVGSRREMVRRHWKVLDSVIDRHYGLGTIHGGNGDWAWYGHSGVFPGCFSHTCIVPAAGLTLSVIINAPDVVPATLVEGLIEILKVFKANGAPAATLAPWTGRWWSMWGPVDLLAVGNKVIVAVPGQANPFTDASEIVEVKGNVGIVGKATGFTNYRETARLETDGSGKPVALWLGGIKLLPEAEAAAETGAKFQVAATT
ncbi:beta-lactamase family protein [Phreatobacter aquaticus]|uniref:Beta-lactamase family protein n=1 Tax=Phreatobacter aquaticus TaxID=2570229 RepID=A0A4D7QNQ3_9HYPH|nr:serine hydrolase domain-containing protein [Phreatobacter aquaticus]QCK87543.1 beta-lactamase family protein [Phreatobacter aquaticus]